MADHEIDGLIERYRCEDLKEITQLSHKLIQKITTTALMPGWVRPWYRVGQWRWVKYPKDYNVRESREPFEFHIHWIDSEERPVRSRRWRMAKLREPRPFRCSISTT